MSTTPPDAEAVARELDVNEYREAVASRFEDARPFSVAYDWHDKPHRLVFDLCLEIERLRADREDVARRVRVTYENDEHWQRYLRETGRHLATGGSDDGQ